MSAGAGASRRLPLLVILFAGSGCSALIYEIVWFQSLQLAIGSTSVSMGVLLATYMGGLCLGSLLLPRLRLPQHPLRVYGALEAGIAVCGLLTLAGLPLVGRVYIAGAEHGLPGMLLRGLVCAICLLPPTVLMGASLPAIVRWTESTPRGASWWGLLYGGNTLGAVFGCLLAGFYILRTYNMATATLAAAALNVAVAALSFSFADRTPARWEEGAPDSAEARPVQASFEAAGSRWTVYVTIALSGAAALGAEVVWTRLMGYMLGATVYNFAVILAVFLIGLALGSLCGSWLLEVVSPRAALGWCQMLLAAGIAWTAYMIADSLPFWPINPMLTLNPWHIMQLDMVRCLWAILPPTILWGASFPLACAAAASPGDDPGRVVGGVYAANTVGAIVGALGASLVLIPWIGAQQTERALLIASAAGALIVLTPYFAERRSKLGTPLLAASMLVAGLLAYGIDAVPGKLIAYGRKMSISSGKVVYVKEGRNSTVAISQWPDGAWEVDVNGHVEATTEPYDMKLQRSVGHVPGLLHKGPKSVLGIGFGAGVSAGAFTTYPTIEKITVCEIEPVIPPTSSQYFASEDYSVLYNPKTHMIYDDARHYLMTTPEKFDIIASDPLDVFVKGTAALYSREYFEAVKRHLNPGGMFSLYVPLYESDENTVRSEIATFFEAFPNGSLWANTIDGRGYDMVFLGQVEPLQIDLDEVQQRLTSPSYARVAQSLRDIGVYSAMDMFAGYSGQKSDLGPWLQGAQLNTDGDLRLQYLAGWGINSSQEDFIYRQMLKYRRSPANLFVGAPEKIQELLSSMGLN
ncbi:MAG: fused MFS/spermidine synthase [Bryobacteraceae bacterium]|jgi:spermidine synthase